MSQLFDFVVVGGGSAGAVIAARLSEDPGCRVALLEAGGRPPEVERMPGATAALQLDPATDWMYTADPGNAGLGLRGRRVPVPRGRMLGGSSSLNYMVYVRGHPGDFDAWADRGATGWSYAEVLPYFRKSEGLAPSDDVVIDAPAHGTDGPLGVSVRSPVLEGAREFVEAAIAAGIPRGDYNGRDRGGAAGVVSLTQTTTRRGRRSSTYRAFLEGEPERRENLTILSGHAGRVVLEGAPGSVRATGVEYRDGAGALRVAVARREVILCAGAVGSPCLLLRSGVGPRREIEALGIRCLLDAPQVGKHLKDHIQVPLVFAAPGIGLRMSDVRASMGPAALRHPAGPLPADPRDDDAMPAHLQALKREAQGRLSEWETTGRGLPSTSLYEACGWFSTGLGDPHSHDAQIGFVPCTYDHEQWHGSLGVDTTLFFDDAETRLAPDAEGMLVLANPVLPRSLGEIALSSADPKAAPAIRMNYLSDPHDLEVMVAVVRRALDVVTHWPAHRRIGSLMVPPILARRHGHRDGATPSDALLEDYARYFSLTVYHLSCTCRIGSVVDPRLRVLGASGLRVADASVMPEIVSGNTNAASIMIGEKAAEMIAVDHDVRLAQFVGERSVAAT